MSIDAEHDRFTIASRLRDPITGEEREMRIVVDRERGVMLELMETTAPYATARADVTQWAPGLRDSLAAILGPVGAE